MNHVACHCELGLWAALRNWSSHLRHTDPRKVLGFLDLFGAWDPTLAFVMAGAVAVTSLGFALARRRSTPILAERSVLPTQTGITARLLVGGGLFGIGWGLVGLCPGPALVNLAGLNVPVILFVTAMAAGMSGYDLWQTGFMQADRLEDAR